MRNRVNLKPVVMMGLSALLLWGLVACGGATPTPAPASVTETEAETGDEVVDTAVSVPSGVLAEGVVEPVQFTHLSFQRSGQIVTIPVQEGQTVQAGDVLIELDDTDAQINLQQAEARLSSQQAALESAQIQLAVAQQNIASAEAQVEAAKANLALTIAGARPEEIAAAEANVRAAEAGITRAVGQRDQQLNIGTDAQVNAAEARLAAATAQLQAVNDAYQNVIDACFTLPDGSEVCPAYGPIEEQLRAQREAAQAQYDAAQAQLAQLQGGATAVQTQAAQGGVGLASAQRNIAQAQLDLLLAGATPEQIAQAEAAVAQAEAAVQIAVAGVAQAEAAVIQAEAGVVTAETAVAVAQVALDRLTLLAPYAGTITTLPVQVGAVIGAGQIVSTIADLAVWQVRTTDLTELDVPTVSDGASVVVTFDAIPNEEVTGTVLQIAYLPSFSQGDVVYEVLIDLTDNDVSTLPLRWGMTAFVNVEP
jgi:HlyD family secretion protein